MVTGRRQLVWPAIATVIGCAILVGLGVWQLERLQWKQALIATVEDHMAEAAVALPPASQWTASGFIDAWEYRPVFAEGVFHQPVHDDPSYGRVYSLANLSEPKGPLGGLGYWVMNAFYPESGGTVYVNRGFVPSDRRGSETPPPRGRVFIVGVVLPTQPGNFATPDCEADAPICYTRDVKRFASGTDDPAPAAPFFIDFQTESTDPGGLPQAGETRVSFPNNHLQYALTWFGLALGLVAVFVAFVRSRMRR
jgi:surfeit locus 1 family protein